MIYCRTPTEAAVFLGAIKRYRADFVAFVVECCQILADEGDGGEWVPFALWPEQLLVARALQVERLLAVLKARQVGLTWLVLALALWLVTLHPIATVLIFSRRDDESSDLLTNRLRKMYDRLPDWLKHEPGRDLADGAGQWQLSNGSRVLAFPTTAGDSYTGTLAICDEFDLVDEKTQRRLLAAVKPTIDAGGRMVLLSRPDKSKPSSPFKRIYRAAKEGKTAWKGLFLPWSARPERTQAWYEEQRRDILARTGSEDDLHEQYPASDVEALSPRTLDKRIAPQWLQACYCEALPLTVLPHEAPAIPGLEVYALPFVDRWYVVGADPAEGNPTSDDSALDVHDVETGEQVAVLAGKFQPSTLAAHADVLGQWYNQAAVMVERNNHGHAVLLWLSEYSALQLLYGHDRKVGWLSSGRGKALLYDATADQFRNRETVCHSFASFAQLASIEGGTLRAPEGEHDDRADSYALCCAARRHVRWEQADEPEQVTVLR